MAKAIRFHKTGGPEVLRPGQRPVPSPAGLVVKKGSKRRKRLAGAMPGPVSTTSKRT